MKRVRVQWNPQPNFLWNETCAHITEHFGLPGDRYLTSISTDGIDFNFKDERDALLCQILISDQT